MPLSRPDLPSVCSCAGPATSDGGASRPGSRSRLLRPRRGRARSRARRPRRACPRLRSAPAREQSVEQLPATLLSRSSVARSERRRAPRRGRPRGVVRRRRSAGQRRGVPLLLRASRQRRRRSFPISSPSAADHQASVRRPRSAIGVARQLRPGQDSIGAGGRPRRDGRRHMGRSHAGSWWSLPISIRTGWCDGYGDRLRPCGPRNNARGGSDGDSCKNRRTSVGWVTRQSPRGRRGRGHAPLRRGRHGRRCAARRLARRSCRAS